MKNKRKLGGGGWGGKRGGGGGGGIAASWDYTEVSYHHAPAALFSGKNPGAHRIGGFVGPSAVLDVLRKTKITCWNSNPGPSSP